MTVQKQQLDMYWDDGSKVGMYSGAIKGMGRTATTTYVGHAFKFVDPGSKELVARLVMRSDTTMYIIEPEESDATTLDSAEYKRVKAEAKWYADYYQKHGIPWLSVHNRPRPELNMWPAERLGQVHRVTSRAGYWQEGDGPGGASLAKGVLGSMLWGVTGSAVGSRGGPAVTDNLEEPQRANRRTLSKVDGPHHQSTAPVELNMTVVSKGPEGPRVFLVENLLSDFECDHIVREGSKVVRPSIVGQDGGFKSRTRTSENGWLSRQRTPVLDTVHRRMADVLGLHDSMVRSGANAEELQVVRYEPGQQYQPHHDFSDAGVVQQRFLTLLLYIYPPQKGGYTSFPKAHDGRGLRVKPPKGSGVLFYSMLPDGNGDDLSLHAGEPVLEGRKWVCNLWIWDPIRYVSLCYVRYFKLCSRD
jgi:prolyl 4-hydroxylase